MSWSNQMLIHFNNKRKLCVCVCVCVTDLCADFIIYVDKFSGIDHMTCCCCQLECLYVFREDQSSLDI